MHKKLTPLLLAALLCSLGCKKSSAAAQAPDAGSLAAAPTPTSAFGYQSNLFARALDVSCAPPGADAGVEGCIALVRYGGTLSGPGLPDAGEVSNSDRYGSIAFLRTDATGKATWAKTLMSGFSPGSLEWGQMVDDDLRVQLLGTGEFLVSGSYEGRWFVGTPGGNNQELGPSSNRNLMVVMFHPDGTFDDWEDTGNGNDLHAYGVAQLPDTKLVIAGTCTGDVPLDNGSFPCGTTSPYGYLFTIHDDGSTVGGQSFGAPVTQGFSMTPGTLTAPAEAKDIVSDASGNVYVSGSFYESMIYGTLPADIAAGEDDGFLMQVKPDGTRGWITLASGLGHERGGRVARVPGGTLWTARVSLGGRIGETVYPAATHVISKIDDAGKVLWTEAVPDAKTATPLGVAAAEDGSFALYGDGYLARYDAAGKELWQTLDAEVRGASFTKTSLVVAANAVGSNLLGASIAATNDQALRAALVLIPR